MLWPGDGYNENIRLRTAALSKSYLKNYSAIRSPTDINKMHDHIKHTVNVDVTLKNVVRSHSNYEIRYTR
jgi:hypothetical protein